nr:ECF transporter S component [Oscillospiraceae bacterium]
PVCGVLIAFIAAFIEFLTFSTTAWYGFVMNFASSAVFSLTAALIYKYKRTLNGALVGYLFAVIATTGVMLLLNSFVTPIYLVEFVGMPEVAATETVIDLLPKVLLPFNLAKSILNASVAMLLYKPVVTALRKARITSGGSKGNTGFNRSSIVILVIGSIALAVSITILLIIW